VKARRKHKKMMGMAMKMKALKGNGGSFVSSAVLTLRNAPAVVPEAFQVTDALCPQQEARFMSAMAVIMTSINTNVTL
jgi:hypothetical protein